MGQDDNALNGNVKTKNLKKKTLEKQKMRINNEKTKVKYYQDCKERKEKKREEFQKKENEVAVKEKWLTRRNSRIA